MISICVLMSMCCRSQKRLSSPGHNNIIRLVDVRENGAEYVVGLVSYKCSCPKRVALHRFLLLMELCDGGTLANVIEQHKFSVSEVRTSTLRFDKNVTS